jgi:hypothetical protein
MITKTQNLQNLHTIRYSQIGIMLNQFDFGVEISANTFLIETKNTIYTFVQTKNTKLVLEKLDSFKFLITNRQTNTLSWSHSSSFAINHTSLLLIANVPYYNKQRLKL